MTVYDSMTGEYLGCMGKRTWERLLEESRDYTTDRWKDADPDFSEAQPSRSSRL